MPRQKKIRILFDANPLAQSSKSGVGYYTYRLIEALAVNYPDQVQLIGHYYDFLGRKREWLDLPIAPNIQYTTTRLIPGKVFSLLQRRFGIAIPIELLARQRGDVLLFPNFAALPSIFRSPRVVTIHDLYFMRQPEFIQPKNLTFMRRFVRPSIEGADLLLAVSKFTKNELADLFGVKPNKVLVTPIPPRPLETISSKRADELLNDMDIHKNYLLFLGTLEPRKNISALIAAFQLLDSSVRQKYTLVLAGGKGWHDDDLLQAIISAKQRGISIVTPGYISDEQKIALYNRADLTVIPSFYEGFGMQLLEAMQAGVPVVASDITVFREVAGDAALYFDPLQPESIAKSITIALNDKALRSTLIASGKQQLTNYDWSNIASDLYQRLQKIVKATKQ